MPKLHEPITSRKAGNWIRKSVIGLLIVVFCAGLLSNVYIDLSYWANMPRTPDAVTGRVFDIYVNHHTLVYVTRGELDRAKFVFGFVWDATIAAGVLLAFVKVYWKDPSRPNVLAGDPRSGRRF